MHRSYSDVMLPRGSRKEWRQRFSFRQKSLKTDQVSATFCVYVPSIDFMQHLLEKVCIDIESQNRHYIGPYVFPRLKTTVDFQHSYFTY